MNWKMRSKIYHMMTPEPGDDLRQEIIVEEWDKNIITNRALDYWRIQTKELYYPAKSYAIATTYAILLAFVFGGDHKDYLKDSDLLAGNDPYFEPLSEDNKEIYEALVASYSYALKNKLQWSENYKKTIDYFYKEFLLAEDTKQWLSSEERRN